MTNYETPPTPNPSLDDLDDDEFVELMKLATWKSYRWDPFMEEHIIDRTLDALRKLHAELDAQLSSDERKEDLEWLGRVTSLRARVRGRKGQVMAKVKEMNRAETASAQAYERKWSTFTEALVVAIEESISDHILDEVYLPDGEINAREWLAARRAIAASKRERATA